MLRAFKHGILFRVQSIDEIAERSLIPAEQVASILDDLIERELVAEIDDDRYVITAEGRAALDEFRSEMRGGARPRGTEGAN